MSPNSSLLTRRFAELSHIATTLPVYADHFTGPAYAWLTPDFITSRTAPAQQFFATAAALSAKVAELSQTTLAAKAEVVRLTSGTRRALQASAIFTGDTTWNDRESAPSAEILLRGAELVQILGRLAGSEHFASAYLDANRLRSDLESALAAYSSARTALATETDRLDAEEKRYVEYEDAVDDLWHTVTNALDGLFHEEREILYAFMPWRQRTSNTASNASTVEPAIEPTPQP